MNVVSNVITICTAIKYTYGIIKYMFSSDGNKSNIETINEHDIDDNIMSNKISPMVNKINFDDLMKELKEKIKVYDDNMNDKIIHNSIHIPLNVNNNNHSNKKINL